MWLRLAGRPARPRGSRRWSASYAGTGYPKTLISSHGPLSRIERGRWTARLLNGLSRTSVVRDCREARTASPAAACCWWVSGRECDLPAEAGEFAGDRDGNDAVGLLAHVLELVPAGVQATLRAPRDVDHSGVLAALAALERFGDAGAALVVVGRFDQQPACVC